MDAIPFCCESEGMVERVHIGTPLAPDSVAVSLRIYEDDTIRFEHICDRGRRGKIVCSPAIQHGPHGSGHRVLSRDPWSIEPSILCPDCGTHGYVRGGLWEAV